MLLSLVEVHLSSTSAIDVIVADGTAEVPTPVFTRRKVRSVLSPGTSASASTDVVVVWPASISREPAVAPEVSADVAVKAAKVPLAPKAMRAAPPMAAEAMAIFFTVGLPVDVPVGRGPSRRGATPRRSTSRLGGTPHRGHRQFC